MGLNACVEERQQYTAVRPFRTYDGPECAYERIAKEYAARGETMPSSLQFGWWAGRWLE